MVDKAAQNLLDTLMSTRRDSLRLWWSKFEQVKQLSELMGHSLTSLIDDFIHAAPTDPRNGQAMSFEEYLLHRAVTLIPDLLRLCPRPFFDLMDVAELVEGRNETRSKASWKRMAPLLCPLAGTEGVAAIVYDELVKDTTAEEELQDGIEESDLSTAPARAPKELTFKRFEEYIDALCKAEFETNYAEHWSVIKEQCGLVATEKCVLHTPYAADCSQFPPAVGSLYLSAEHLVFQDPVLHNRRVISLSTVLDVKRVPVELRHARLLLSQIPGLGLFARGGVLGGLARLAGFQQGASTPAGNGSPNPKQKARVKPPGSEEVQAAERGGTGAGGAGGAGAGGADDSLGLSAVLVRWQGGSAKFMFVEVSGLILAQWLKHLQELVLAHKLSFSRASRSINMFESYPWLPAFVAENLQRAQALESLLGWEVPQLLICTANSSAPEPDDQGGRLVRELYVSYGAAQRYQRLEETERNLDIFNLKTFDQNLAMLEDLSADLLLALKDLEALTTWERPLHTITALGASLAVFYYDALSLIIPGALLGVAGRMIFQGVGKMFQKWRKPALKLGNDPSASSVSLLLEEGKEAPASAEKEGEGPNKEGGGRKRIAPTGNVGAEVGNGNGGGGVGEEEAQAVVIAGGGSRAITEGSLRQVGGLNTRGQSVHTRGQGMSGPPSAEGAFESGAESVDGGSGDEEAPGKLSPLSNGEPEEAAGEGGVVAAEPGGKGWLRRMGETVVTVRKFRSNIRRLLQENLIQVEKHLQVGLQVGREKTQKLSQLQNTVQMVNRLLAKLAVLHSWEHPRQSCNYVLLVASTGTFLAVIPPRWLFLAAVVGKFSPGDTMTRRVQTATLFLARRYLDPPDDPRLEPEEEDAPAAAVMASTQSG